MSQFFVNSVENNGLDACFEALARHPNSLSLDYKAIPLGHDEARLLQMALCNMPSLQVFLALTLLDSGKKRRWRNLHRRYTTTRPSKC
jgi:hypothetical protein